MNEKIKIIRKILYNTIFILIFASCNPLTSTSTTQSETTELANSTDATLASTSESIPELSPVFQTELLNPLDVPHTYVDETCRYLRNKWNPSNAKPGTVVMVVMVGRIQAGVADEPGAINVADFIDVMEQLKAQGFEAINMRQFLFYIERNVEIPERSVLLIQDGNYEGQYYYNYYRDYWENWGWPVVNGWQSNSDVEDFVVMENQDLEAEGFVDHQSQGVDPQAKLSDESAKSVIARELQTPWDEFAYVYKKNPYAIIWPNGGFGLRPALTARLLKYQLGFTTNSRGPVMYNWIPLGDAADPERPDYIPEGPIGDPLMTIPRYSINETFTAIDQVRAIGKEAAAYAEQNKETEYQYYDIVCSDEYGPIPTP